MHRSHWDIEVYAKDFQESRWREAARRRLVDEAVGRGAAAVAVNPFNLAIARLLNAWDARLAPARTAETPRPIAEDVEPAGSADVAPPSRPKRARLSQPYADMVVIARGPMVGVTEQPCGVGDC